MEWITSDKLESGDIIETRSKVPPHSPLFKGAMVPFIKHYGMIVFINGKPNIVHNIIGRHPTITPYEEVFTNRRVERVLRTGMTDDQILSKYEKIKDKKYNLMSFNCENLMTYMCDSSIGFPQKQGWSIGIFSVLSLILLVLILRPSKA